MIPHIELFALLNIISKFILAVGYYFGHAFIMVSAHKKLYFIAFLFLFPTIMTTQLAEFAATPHHDPLSSEFTPNKINKFKRPKPTSSQVPKKATDLPAGYDFPKPTGEYNVGTVRYHMIDRDRLDPYDKTLFRELMVQVWYPTAQKNSEPKAHGHYLPELMPHMKRLATDIYHVPQAVLDYLLVDIKCHAHDGAPLLEHKQKFPVIVLCHGLSSMAALHTAQAENLASHGYIVFGINHTFTCSFSIFPDGRMYQSKFDWQALNKIAELTKIITLWQEDVRFVLSCIEGLETEKYADLQTKDENMFYHKLDLTKIGMLGHSMGGATTTQILRHDDRVKAGINLDGPLCGENYDDEFNKPYMVMVAENSLKRTNATLTDQELLARGMQREEEDYLRQVFKFGLPNLCSNIRATGAEAYYVFMHGAGHNTFTDVPLVKDASFLLSFLEYFGLNTGTIAPLRAIKIINELIVDFFNKHLLRKPAVLLEMTHKSPFEEVVISR